MSKDKKEEKKVEKIEKTDKAEVAVKAAPRSLGEHTLLPYKDLKELASNYRNVELGVQRNMLRGAWWLGYHVDAMLESNAYGSCGMEKMCAALFPDLTDVEQKSKQKTLYLYARFNRMYDWDVVEKRLIANRIPLRNIERLLTIKDDKLRTKVENDLIKGKTIHEALEAAGLVHKALPAGESDGVLDDSAESAEPAKPSNTKEAGKVLRAAAQIEAAVNQLRGFMKGMTKALKAYDSCTDAKDRKAVSEELAKLLTGGFDDLAEEVTEVSDAIKKAQE